MLTLFMMISQGMQWEDALRPLRDVSAVAVILVLVYAPRSPFRAVSERISGGDHRFRGAQRRLARKFLGLKE